MNNKNNYKVMEMADLFEFEEVFDNINDVLILNDTNGRLLKVNQKAIEFLGYSKNNLLEMNVRDFEKDFNQLHFEKRIAALLQEKKYTFNTTLITNSGKCLNVEFDSKLLNSKGSPIVYNFIKNNSTNLMDENEFGPSEQQDVLFETILNKVPTALFTFDNGINLQRINNIGKNYFNVDLSDDILKGQSLKKLFQHIQVVAPFNAIDNELIPNSSLFNYIETTIHKKQEYDKEELILFINEKGKSTKKICLFSTTLIKQNGSTIYLATIDDFTERKKNEDLLAEYKAKATECKRLKTAFLHNISHQIRTPLNGILGFIALLEEMESDFCVSKQLQYTSIIKKSSHRLLHTMTDIVKASQLNSKVYEIEKNEINVIDVITYVEKEIAKAYYDSNVNFSYHIDSLLATAIMETNFNELCQVLLQLLSNAFKFTQIGSVQLIVENQEENILFTIKDTGIGINNTELDTIFEPFRQLNFTEKNAIQGNGLGLTLCKEIISLLGGSIEVTSVLNGGSSFFFTLPKKTEKVHSA